MRHFSQNLYSFVFSFLCMQEFRRAVAAAVAEAADIPEEEADRLIAQPPDSAMGDYAFPCFALSRQLRKSPVEIAKELEGRVSPGKLVEGVRAVGPYLNFFLSKAQLASDTVGKVLKEKGRFGSMKLKGRKALVEHTSINPNASPHVGRARNSIIGDSIARILRFHGYRTEVHYFVNDIGKQIAMLVLGCQGRKPGFEDLLSEYIRINREVEENPELEKKVFGLLKLLEEGDKKTISEFRKVVGICVDGQKGIMEELGIRFDFFDYESGYLWSRETVKILERLGKTGRLGTDGEGRTVLNLEGFGLGESSVLVLTRADKTSLYGLRDMAYNLDKAARARDRNIVVLGEDHKLYFRQVSAALSLLGLKAPEVVHYSFVLLSSGKMSTRSGNVVLLADFMQQAVEKAEAEVSKRDIGEQERKAVARAVGYGAIKYHIIRVGPEKNVTFDWEQALSFEGESAPYIQYAHARICSILRKAGADEARGMADFSLLKSPEEFELVKTLAVFPEVAERACVQLRPNLVANYAQQLADQFNRFYHACPVLSGDASLKKSRLALIKAVRQVLDTSLSLIGIEAVERM